MVLTLPDTDLPKAKAILQEVAKELTVILTDATNQHKERLRKTEAKGLEKRLREADDRLAELALKEQGLFKVGGMVFFDLDGITRRIGELQARMQESRLALESKRARMLAMSRRAAEIAAMAADKVKQDPVAVELKKIVQLQERAREMTHKAAERRSNTTLRLQADKVELGEIEYKRHREKLDKLEELLKEGAASQDQLREQSKKYLEARYALKEAKMLLKFLEEDPGEPPRKSLTSRR